MMFWLIAAAVVLVLFAIAWWTSGRTRRGIDSAKVNRVRAKGGSDAGNYNSNPGGGGGGGF